MTDTLTRLRALADEWGRLDCRLRYGYCARELRAILDEAEAQPEDAAGREISDYANQMDRAGGGIYTADFRAGFRHAMDMHAASDSRNRVAVAARAVLDHVPTPTVADATTGAAAILDSDWLTARVALAVTEARADERERIATAIESRRGGLHNSGSFEGMTIAARIARKGGDL